MAKYISAWTVYTETIGQNLEATLEHGEIDINDTVWSGPSGDYVVTASPAELDEEYIEFTDRGTVSEFLHDAD